jgi:hypothetical protein
VPKTGSEAVADAHPSSSGYNVGGSLDSGPWSSGV